MSALRLATLMGILVIVYSVVFTLLTPAFFAVFVLISVTACYIFCIRVNHESTRFYLGRICHVLRLPTRFRQWIFGRFTNTDIHVFPIRSQYCKLSTPLLCSSTPMHNPDSSINKSHVMIEGDESVANAMGLNTRAVTKHEEKSLSKILPDRSPSLSSIKKLRSSFAAPRGRAVGVKTCHSVAGPTLASTRFKQNLDYCVYADCKSPGFSDRIASYHQEANSESPSSCFTTPGQYPSVKLVKDNVRLVTMKNRPKPYIPVTVRVAPPVREYTSPSKFERLREDKRETPTQSVLDALKEISRKRIHGEAEDAELNKRYKNDGLDTTPTLTEDVCTASGDTSNNKRVRDKSPVKLPVAKRPCSNAIDSSLSSTIRLSDNKRKAGVAVISSPSPGPSSSRKKFALVVPDVEYDLSEETPTVNKTNKSIGSEQKKEESKNTNISSDEKSLITPVAESSEPLRSLFGTPTSPQIDTSIKKKKSPVFATMETEDTSAAEQTSRNLRRKKLKSLFDAIRKDEETGSTHLTTSLRNDKSKFPAVSLMSSTTLTAAISTPVVSTAQHDDPSKFGFSNANSLQKSHSLTPAGSFASQIQSDLQKGTVNDSAACETNTTAQGNYEASASSPASVITPSTKTPTKDDLILEQPKEIVETLSLINVSSVQTSGTSQFAAPVTTPAPLNQLLSLQKPQTHLGVVNSGVVTSATTSFSSSASDLIINFGSPSSNFMKNLIPSSQPVETSSAAKPTSEELNITVTTCSAIPPFGNLSFGSSPANSSFAAPSSMNLNSLISKQNAPPSYSASVSPSYATAFGSIASANITSTACTNSTTTSNAPVLGMNNSTVSTFGNCTLPFATNSNIAPPPAYSSSTSAPTTANNVQPAFGNANLSFPSNNEVSNFGASNKSLNNTLIISPFGSSNSPFAPTGVPPAYSTSNLTATPPTASLVNSANITGSTIFQRTPKPTGFGSEQLNFGSQKQTDSANAFASPGFGSSTAGNPPQFPQAPTPSSNSFGFSATPTTSSNAFSLPTTTASSGLFQFGQAAASTSAPFGQTTTNMPSAFGQSPSNITAPFFHNASNTLQFGQSSNTSAPFGQSTAPNVASPFGQAATNMASPFGQTASNTSPQFGQTASNTTPQFGQTAPSLFGQSMPNAASPFGQSSANTANKSVFSSFSFADAQPVQTTEAAPTDFGSPTSKPIFPNIFGAPPNQSPFQQTVHNLPTSSNTSMAGFSNVPLGPLSFSKNTASANTISNTQNFSFGGSKPADLGGFSFNVPVSKTSDTFGYPFGGGSQQHQQQTFGADPNVNAPAAFSLGQGVGASTFQFNAGSALPQPQGVLSFGTVPSAAGSNCNQYGATTSYSPYNFAPGGGMFSIGAGAANRTRPGAMRRRKPN